MRMALEFAKYGAAKYISHLDLQRAFSRALRRSGLPVKLSEGFNPHYIVSFASALPVGMESECECVEMALSAQVSPDEFLLKIARALPPGLEAKRAVRLREDAPKLMAALHQAAYTAEVTSGDFEAVKQAAETIMASQEYIAVKKTRDKQKDVDIRPMIYQLTAEAGGLVMLLAAAQTGTLRPDMLMQAIEHMSGPLSTRLKRTALFACRDNTAVPLLSAFMV